VQIYLMWTGVVVAYIFTAVPEWTTWVMLAAMALYDLFAVLTPSGPLQMLVNLAIERDQDIPALVYEAREVRRRGGRGRGRLRRDSAPAAAAADVGADASGGAREAPPRTAVIADALAVHHARMQSGVDAGEAGVEVVGASQRAGPVAEARERAADDIQLVDVHDVRTPALHSFACPVLCRSARAST
jgi:Presenilin